MPDREKVIKDLMGLHGSKETMSIIADAIAMLREKEAVEPEFDSLDGNVGRWRCGNCHISIGAVRAPYCWHCGKAVKWGE